MTTIDVLQMWCSFEVGGPFPWIVVVFSFESVLYTSPPLTPTLSPEGRGNWIEGNPLPRGERELD